MNNKQQMTDSMPAIEETKLTFDEHLQQLPASKQSIHKWLIGFAAAAIIITLGVFVYAIYTSIMWKTAGGTNVVLAWMYFFLAGAVAVFLLGLDTLTLGATIPLPFESSKYNFETGQKAANEGRWMIGYGVVVTILFVLGMDAVRGGRFGVEDWVTMIVSIFVALGVGSGLLAIIRRIVGSRSS